MAYHKAMAQDNGNRHVPAHVAIVMDGNGRWAQQRGLPRGEGHKSGVGAVREAVRAAVACGVRYLTLYAFSTENWKRPPEEVNGLMQLLVESADTYLQEFIDGGIRVDTIGDTSALPPLVRGAVTQVRKMTRRGEKLTLIIALNYGGRPEIVRATRAIAEAVLEGRARPEEIDESMLTQHLYTAGIPDPDLLIRTSGEQRLSNFLLWQLAYTEFYFTPKLWPDFTGADFQAALHDYAQRKRRFGGV